MRTRSAALFLLVILTAIVLAGKEKPEGVELEEYAARRARVLEQVEGPVVLFGYRAADFGLGGPERRSPDVTFRQEDNFYYLTGHREEGAALLLIPATKSAQQDELPSETLFLPPRNLQRERWEGVRLGPEDGNAAARTGFAEVKPRAELRALLEQALGFFPKVYTLLPFGKNPDSRSHAGYWSAWLREEFPQAELADARALLGSLRQEKSASERALLRFAIEQSMEAQRAALRAVRPGLREYEVAALMEYTFKRAGCERPGYAPIVGAGFNSTVLHYPAGQRALKAGEVVLIDVGAECDGYTADITRTLPVSGKFSERQREIYEIVLGAQEAVFAALKPGMTTARRGENSLYRIAYDYINTHGKDEQGEPLGKYFIHGLGHHIGLQVHDAGNPGRPLEPGMILTIEPGIYIPEESLGVRIEDIVLITEDGYELLTASLPRTAQEIEHAIAMEEAGE